MVRLGRKCFPVIFVFVVIDLYYHNLTLHYLDLQ